MPGGVKGIIVSCKTTEGGRIQAQWIIISLAAFLAPQIGALVYFQHVIIDIWGCMYIEDAQQISMGQSFIIVLAVTVQPKASTIEWPVG